MNQNKHVAAADKIGRSDAEKIIISHYILSDLETANDPDPYWIGYHNGLGIAVECLLTGEQKTAIFAYLTEVTANQTPKPQSKLLQAGLDSTRQ